MPARRERFMQDSPFKATYIQKLVSWFWPIRIYHYGKNESYLEVLLYQNRYQLATEDALYSDGDQYAPFRLGFKELSKSYLKNIKTCLVLGSGFGSVAQILHKRYNKSVRYTIVEINEVILNWASELLKKKKIHNVQENCTDAVNFVAQCHEKFDLICMDIFLGRKVPEQFLENDFLYSCKRLLAKNGCCIINYMMNGEGEWGIFRKNAEHVFKNVHIITKRENRILICNN